MRQKTYNDVPPETVIRHMAEERGKLLVEIDELRDEVARKDRAIASFKRWQSKVAEYKWNYWLSEGVRLMETPPDKAMLTCLQNLLGRHRIFADWERKVTNAWRQYEKAREHFAELLKTEKYEKD